MAKLIKRTIQEQTRNRVRIFRGVASIMRRDSASILNSVDIRKALSRNEEEKYYNDQDKKQAPSLSNKLRSWAIDYNVKRRAVSALLKILVSFGFNSLPKDSRTLLKTPRTIQIVNIGGGQYWHNGFQNCLKNVFVKLSCNLHIQLNFNIDGLPLFKSSATTFWPILFNIYGIVKRIFRY